MRGRPVVQWLLFAAAWACLLYPIIRLARRQAPAVPPTAAVSAARKTWVSIRFSSPPSAFALRQGDTVVWQEQNPTGTTFERELALGFDEFGLELGLTAGLPDSLTAIEVTLEPDALSERARTVWVHGRADEVIDFSWGRHD